MFRGMQQPAIANDARFVMRVHMMPAVLSEYCDRLLPRAVDMEGSLKLNK
jgi:hypothetical protein